jgi:hypothetical protein
MRQSVLLFLSVMFVSAFSWAQDATLSGAFDNSIRGNSKWGVSYFSFSSVDAEPALDGAATANIYNYFSLNYKLSRDERINIRPAFSFTTAGYDKTGVSKKADVSMNDAFVNYANYGIALLPGEWALSGQYRIYLPTSESTKTKRTITYLRSWMIAEKLLGNGWSIEYNMKPGLYVQSQKAYRNEYDKVFPDGGSQHRIEVKANQWGEYEHYMKLGKYINSTFFPSLELGFTHEWYYTTTQADRSDASRNQLKIAPNTEIHLNRDLWFILGIENKIDLNDTRLASTWQDKDGQGINLFRPENTQYYLLTFWSL